MLIVSFLINNKRKGITSANLMQTQLLHRTGVVCPILHFYQNLQKAYKSHFEKPLQAYFNLQFFLLLKQWQISKQINSLIEVHYAQIKRNPE
jgi:hypothetical protein